MKKRRLFWKLFPAMLLGVIGSLALFVYITISQLKSLSFEENSIDYSRFVLNLSYSSIAIVFLVGTLCYFVAKWIVRPIEKLSERTNALLNNEDTEFSMDILDVKEISELSSAIRELDSNLRNRIAKVTTQKNEQEALFSSMSDGILVVSDDLRIKRINVKAMRILGLQEEQYEKGKALVELVRLPKLLNHVQKTLVEGENYLSDLSMSGDQIIEVYSSPFINVRSEKNGVVVVLRDVTKARLLDKHRKDFVANVSHELKTPLTSIQGYSETLIKAGVEIAPDKSFDFVNRIYKNSLRLSQIVEDLLYLSKIDKYLEKGEIELVRSNLKNLVTASAETVKEKYSDKQIFFDLNLEDVELPVDFGLFQQVVINLLDNAVKYSAANSKVRVLLSNKNNSIELEVIDSGIGMEQHHQDRVFERFYRADKARSRNSGGTGLGLAIVKNILDLHGARIELESIPQKGSNFKVVLSK